VICGKTDRKAEHDGLAGNGRSTAGGAGKLEGHAIQPIRGEGSQRGEIGSTTDADARRFSMLWETRRIAPGHSNTWFFDAIGMEGGVRFSTREPTLLRRFTVREGEQIWEEVQPGLVSAWPVVSGPIFEFGFGDALLQMWASYLAERAGELQGRFGTATPAEALFAHRVFDAALRSARTGMPESP
jgi:predicted dehydrogenase